MKYTALVVAAGKGLRAGLGYNKVLFYMNKHQNTILGKTLEFFNKDDRCTQIILVCSHEDYDLITNEYTGDKIEHVLGGARRQDSVYNGLQVVKEDIVLVHDGNRPFIELSLIDKILDAIINEDAVLLAVKMKNTVKVVEDGYVKTTIDRDKLMGAQTPQAFKTQILLDAYSKINELGLNVTDDTQAVELIGNARIKIVEGSVTNEKITWSDDFKNL
ncbi:MAG TPA: 2-C-methyl-D-erythritol 4-phosphate cytidylyltransferase [Erysipelothrix sp.]|nr:2-C-methyl-D-erythritol 4-phosphate cytidylyltransferase [Erysipelothrix sp.]